MRGVLEKRIEQHLATIHRFRERSLDSLEELAKALLETLQNGGKLIVFGNGGSAADAQHFACELVGTFLRKTRRALPAIALSTNTSNLTSISNDFSYDDVFKRQLEALGEGGDLCVGISTSGNSVNVHKALVAAREKGCRTAAFLGAGGGSIKDIVDIALIVPSNDTPCIQETHIMAIHIICDIIDDAFLPKNEAET